MANDLKVRVMGVAEPHTGVSAATVGELKTQFNLKNHTAAIGGNSVDDGFLLSDGQKVVFTEANKNG